MGPAGDYTEACQDEPVACAPLYSQDAPGPRDKISGRYFLRSIATINHRNTVLYIFDTISPQQRLGVVRSGYFV
jgi:hypothetical protein